MAKNDPLVYCANVINRETKTLSENDLVKHNGTPQINVRFKYLSILQTLNVQIFLFVISIFILY